MELPENWTTSAKCAQYVGKTMKQLVGLDPAGQKTMEFITAEVYFQIVDTLVRFSLCFAVFAVFWLAVYARAYCSCLRRRRKT